jgi:hypothetical protein
MTLTERIEPYVSPRPHSVRDFVEAALAIDEEHRSGEITTAEMNGRLSMLTALYRDLRRPRG